MSTVMNARERMLRGQAIANDPQPFRCVKCGVAVSHINPGPCKCTQSTTRKQDLKS